MAGHSKWNNIKNRKGAQDAARGKVFGEVAKMIRIAVKEGTSDDPKFNPSLRVALDKARAANMPKEKIKKAVERGLGKSSSGVAIQEIAYEGFGPGGVAMIVVALTDNLNRTAGEMKFAFSRNNGSLGSPGSAMYMFQRSDDGGYTATMKIDIEDKATKLQLKELVEAIREIEDVEDVYLATDDVQEDVPSE